MELIKVMWITGATGLPSDWLPQPAGWDVQVHTPDEALSILPGTSCVAIVLDLPIAEWTADSLLEEVQRTAPGVPVLIRDPGASVSDAVRLAHQGAYQFLTTIEEAFALIEQIVDRFAGRAGGEGWLSLLVGASHEMRRIHHVIRLVGGRRSTVLITGETGTGKELAARSLHLASSRAAGPMVAVNCSALPEHLLESELFGHVRGAFTGAMQSRVGRFEQAHRGTIFLDEIGEMPMELQAKLLRVLQERELQKVGGSETIKIDIRVIAATNCDLAERIAQGRFREDLYYRLNVVPLEMPALRQRGGDIPLLARHFLDKICRAEGLPAKRLTPEAMMRLEACAWPGNVRQLENAIEMAVAMSGERPTLAPSDFPAQPVDRRLALASQVPTSQTLTVAVPDSGLDYERTLAVIERSILEQALRKTGGNKKAAAEMLRLKRTTLSAKVRSLQAVA